MDIHEILIVSEDNNLTNDISEELSSSRDTYLPLSAENLEDALEQLGDNPDIMAVILAGVEEPWKIYDGLQKVYRGPVIVKSDRTPEWEIRRATCVGDNALPQKITDAVYETIADRILR